MCQRNMLVVEHREQVVGSQFFVLRPLLPSFPFLLQVCAVGIGTLIGDSCACGPDLRGTGPRAGAPFVIDAENSGHCQMLILTPQSVRNAEWTPATHSQIFSDYLRLIGGSGPKRLLLEEMIERDASDAVPAEQVPASHMC